MQPHGVYCLSEASNKQYTQVMYTYALIGTNYLGPVFEQKQTTAKFKARSFPG